MMLVVDSVKYCGQTSVHEEVRSRCKLAQEVAKYASWSAGAAVVLLVSYTRSAS